MQRPPITLEAVAQRRERAVLVPGLLPVQRLQLGPLLGLRLTDEGKHRLGKDRPFAVEALGRDPHVAILKQVRFDDSLECRFGMACVYGQNVHFSRRIMPRRLMQGKPRSLHTSGMK
jgi:hypothetical protein